MNGTPFDDDGQDGIWGQFVWWQEGFMGTGNIDRLAGAVAMAAYCLEDPHHIITFNDRRQEWVPVSLEKEFLHYDYDDTSGWSCYLLSARWDGGAESTTYLLDDRLPLKESQ